MRGTCPPGGGQNGGRFRRQVLVIHDSAPCDLSSFMNGSSQEETGQNLISREDDIGKIGIEKHGHYPEKSNIGHRVSDLFIRGLDGRSCSHNGRSATNPSANGNQRSQTSGQSQEAGGIGTGDQTRSNTDQHNRYPDSFYFQNIEEGETDAQEDDSQPQEFLQAKRGPRNQGGRKADEVSHQEANDNR